MALVGKNDYERCSFLYIYIYISLGRLLYVNANRFGSGSYTRTPPLTDLYILEANAHKSENASAASMNLWGWKVNEKHRN